MKDVPHVRATVPPYRSCPIANVVGIRLSLSFGICVVLGLNAVFNVQFRPISSAFHRGCSRGKPIVAGGFPFVKNLFAKNDYLW